MGTVKTLTVLSLLAFSSQQGFTSESNGPEKTPDLISIPITSLSVNPQNIPSFLAQFKNHPSFDIKIEALKGLETLVNQKKENKEKIINSGGFKILLEGFKNKASITVKRPFRIQVYKTLAAILKENPEGQEAFIKLEEGLNLVRDHLKHKRAYMKALAAKFLCVLTKENKNAREALADQGGLHSIVQLLVNPHFKVQIHGARLVCVYLETNTRLESFKQKGTAEKLKTLTKSLKVDVKVEALEALYRLVQRDPSNFELIDSKRFKLRLKLNKKSSNKNIRNISMNILKYFL